MKGLEGPAHIADDVTVPASAEQVAGGSSDVGWASGEGEADHEHVMCCLGFRSCGGTHEHRGRMQMTTNRTEEDAPGATEHSALSVDAALADGSAWDRGRGAAATAVLDREPITTPEPSAEIGQPVPPHSAPTPVRNTAASDEGPQWVDRVTLRAVLITVAMFVAAVAVVFVALAALGGSDTPDSAPAAVPGLPGADGDVTPAAFMGGVIPVSEAEGPHEFTPEKSAGWERTPLAAAIAAVHLSARSSAVVGPDMFSATIATQTVGDSAGLQTQRQTEYDALAESAGVSNGGPIAIATNEIIGWDIPTWDETNPTVWLLVRQPQTTNYTRVEIPLQWDEAAADWKLVAASGFANNTDPDLDRYTRFFDSQGGNE